MINNLIFVMMAVLLVCIVGFIVALVTLHSEVKELKKESELYCDILKSNHEILDRQHELVQSIVNYVDSFTKAVTERDELLETQYATIEESHNTIVDAFRKITDQHKKLLKAWEKIEDRYSDCYETLDHLRKTWDATRDQIETILQPWILDSDQLEHHDDNRSGIVYTYMADAAKENSYGATGT